jgi:hypothetical protein
VAVPSPARSASTPRAFGLRDLRNESIVLGPIEGRRLYVKRWIAAGAVLAGLVLVAVVPVLLVLCAAPFDSTARLPRTTASLSAIVYASILGMTGAGLLASGAWALVVPQLTLAADVLVARAVPFRPQRTIAARDVPWHRGARFVGRYLPTSRATVRRIGIWQLRRADQAALFAWLDAHAVEAPRGT